MEDKETESSSEKMRSELMKGDEKPLVCVEKHLNINICIDCNIN